MPPSASSIRPNVSSPGNTLDKRLYEWNSTNEPSLKYECLKWKPTFFVRFQEGTVPFPKRAAFPVDAWLTVWSMKGGLRLCITPAHMDQIKTWKSRHQSLAKYIFWLWYPWKRRENWSPAWCECSRLCLRRSAIYLGCYGYPCGYLWYLRADISDIRSRGSLSISVVIRMIWQGYPLF